MSLAELLQQHREEYDVDCQEHYGCSCGHIVPADRSRSFSLDDQEYDAARDAYVAHLASVITEFMSPRGES